MLLLLLLLLLWLHASVRCLMRHTQLQQLIARAAAAAAAAAAVLHGHNALPLTRRHADNRAPNMQ
jgi:hypothetical protein